jgi:nicotinamide riboside kinase
MNNKLLRIAIIGPESSGKTTLALALTRALTAMGTRTHYVAEYAREYYADRPYQPTQQDVLAIAQGQCAAEQRLSYGADIIVCDTTVTTCKIWSEVAFGDVDPLLLALHHPHQYEVTLLTKPDMRWHADPLRSYPLGRDWLFTLYQQELSAHGVPWIEVASSAPVRLACALSIVWARWEGA